MAHERVLTFMNSHHESLHAKLLDTGSEDLVILCHGYAASKEGFCLPALAQALASRGKSSLRFDFAGNGESQGSFSFGNYWREVEDLRAAVLFVRQVVKKNVYAIVGHSKGGNVVLLYGSKYDDVQHIVNIAGRGVMDRGIKERFGADILERLAKSGSVEQKVKADGGRTVTYSLTKQAVDERMSLDMLGAAKNITAEVLTIHGTADTVIPVDDAHAFSKAIKNHSLALVEGADHNFRQPAHQQLLLRRVVDFLVAGL